MSVSTPGSDRGPLLPRRRPGPPTPANDWHESARIPCRTPPAFNERPRAGRNDQPGTVRAVQPLSAPRSVPSWDTEPVVLPDRQRPPARIPTAPGQRQVNEPPARSDPTSRGPTKNDRGGAALAVRWYSMTGHLHEGFCRRVPLLSGCFPGSAREVRLQLRRRCVLSAFRVRCRGWRVLGAGHSRLDTAVDGLLPRALLPQASGTAAGRPRSTRNSGMCCRLGPPYVAFRCGCRRRTL